jgi:uncharacterized protein (DUF58 family)
MGKLRKTYPEGIRITRVGFWFVALTLVVSVAATNTGNNALYIVLATMLALLIVSGLLSRSNLRQLEIEVEASGEIFARRPFQTYYEIANHARFLPRWLIVLSLSHSRGPAFVPVLKREAVTSGRIDTMVMSRGLHKLEFAHIWSVFPLGLFRKGMRYRLDLEVLAFPEIFPQAATVSDRAARVGDETTRERGWGHELHSLREFRPGDDPRGIHWKRSAQSEGLVYMEREAEEGRRLSIVFDNAVGKLRTEAAEERFEILVSEAATAAHRYLEAGFEIELVTRDQVLGFGTGEAHRRRVLEHLALIEPRVRRSHPLMTSDPSVPELRLSMKAEEAA